MEASWRRNYLRYKSFFLNILSQYKERSELKAYLEILLSLTTISVFAIFALRPTILTIAELIGQIEEKKDTVARMDQKIENLSSAQSLYDREGANIELLINYSIPKSTNSDIFARHVEALSVKHSLSITTFKLGRGPIYKKDNSGFIVGTDVSETTNKSGLDFNLTVTSSLDNYAGVESFLREFENLRTPPEIRSVNLNAKSEDRSAEKSLVLSIEGSLPYLE